MVASISRASSRIACVTRLRLPSSRVDADAGRLVVLGVEQHHVGDVDRAFLLDDAADRLGARLRVLRPSVGRWWRLTMFRPSTKTRRFFGSTRSTCPSCPCPCRDHDHVVVLADLASPWPSEHLRGERDDLHEVAVAQLAGDRAEDAGAARVVLRRRSAPRRSRRRRCRCRRRGRAPSGAHDDGLDDLALLDACPAGSACLTVAVITSPTPA